MKRVLFLTILFLTVLLTSAVNLELSGGIENYRSLGYFSLPDISVSGGETFVLPVSFNCDEDVRILAFSVSVPDGFEVISVKKTSRVSGTFQTGTPAGACNVAIYDLSGNAVVEAGEGAIVNITLKAPDAAGDSFAFTISQANYAAVGQTGNTQYPADVTATITVESLLCDFMVNGIYYNITGENTVEVTYKDTSYGTYSGSVTIPGSVTHNGVTYSVTSIGHSAFYNCEDLTSVNVPSSVVKIEYSAFGHCHNLTDLMLPNTIKSIGTEAFYDCTGLTSFTFPDAMSSTGQLVFSDCTGLKSVNLNRIKTIDTFAFLSCSSLTNVTNLSSVQTIGGFSFALCTSLESIEAPNSVTSILGGAFTGCTSLKSVIIGENVDSIGKKAFENCENLSSVVSLATTPPVIKDDTFDESHYSTVKVTVPSSSLPSYHAADYWMNFLRLQADAAPGDANGDGEITIGDVSVLIDLLLDGNPVVSDGLDVNGDGVVTIADVSALIDMLLGL